MTVDDGITIEGDLTDEPTIPVDDSVPSGYLSVSQVGLYLKCPAAYQFRYIQKKRGFGSAKAIKGKSVHSAAELLLTGKMEGRDVSREEMLDRYSTEFDASIDKEEVKSTDDDLDLKEEIGAAKDAGVSATKLYHSVPSGNAKDAKTKQPIDEIIPTAVEKEFRVWAETDSSDPVVLRGFIDVEEEHAVRDLKVRSKKGTAAEAIEGLQLSVYSHVTGKPVVSIDEVVDPTKTMGTRFFRNEHIHTSKSTKYALSVIGDAAEAIRAGVFPKTNPENWWCGKKWCDYWKDCRGKYQ